MEEITCRICLQESNMLLSIFTKHEELSPSPCQMLRKLNLIQNTDIGSSSICSHCLSELENCVQFFEKCEKSNKILSKNLTHHKSLDLQCLQNEYLHIYPEPNPLFMNVENVVDNEGPDFETTGQKHQTCNPCTECGSKRNCVHKPPTIYTCDICHKVFTKKFNYTIHVKRHLGLREWPCPTCGAPQVSSWLAKRHCAPGSRFVCPAPDCTRSYTSAHNLSIHFRNHTGDKPHKCTECGKRFISKTILNAHFRIHTGVKPYMCSICGAQFATNKLVAHLRTHAKPKPRDRQPMKTETTRSQQSGMYACVHCSMRYSHKQSLNRHLRKRHGKSQKRNDSSLVSDNVNTVNG